MSLILGALVYNTWRLREDFKRNSNHQQLLRERQKKLEFILGNRYRHQQLKQVVTTENADGGTQTVSTQGNVPGEMSEAGFRIEITPRFKPR